MEKGFGLIGLIIAIALTATVVGGSMYIYNQNTRINDLSMKVKQETTTSPSIMKPEPSLMMTSPSATITQVTKGTISGTLIYPAEVLPPEMITCAQDTTSNVSTCTSQKKHTDKGTEFSLQVSPGIYYVYSQIPTNPKKAYYTEFVTCGLKYECPSHKKISVTVEAGKTVPAPPQDWYEN